MNRWVAQSLPEPGFVLLCFVSPDINPVFHNAFSESLIPNLEPNNNYLSSQIIGFFDRNENFGIICSLLILQVKELRPEGEVFVQADKLISSELMRFY